MEVEKRRIALLYPRVSTKQQEKSGNGLKSQEHFLRQRCLERGYEIREVFADSYSGGGSFWDRPAMRSLIEYVDHNPLADDEEYVVLFDDIKRFARDVQFHLGLRKELSDRSVAVECLNFKFKDSPENEFIEVVLAAQAELERKQNARQVRRRMQARLENGHWPFGPLLGYRFVAVRGRGKVLRLNKRKSEQIARALEGRANGVLASNVAMARFLERVGFRKRVTANTVTRLIANAYFYAGFVEYAPWGVSRREGVHTAIISMETAEKLSSLDEEPKKVSTRRDMSEDFPLRGYVRCSECDGTLTGAWSKGRCRRYAYYRCNRRGCCEYSKGIPRDRLHSEFRSVLERTVPKPETVKRARELTAQAMVRHVQDQVAKKSESAKELKACELEIRDLAATAAAAHPEVRKVYEEQILKLCRRKQELEGFEKPETPLDPEAVGTVVNEVTGLLIRPETTWKDGTLTLRRKVLELCFDRGLSYDRETGFGTPKISLGIELLCELEVSDSRGVYTPGGSLNTHPSICWEVDRFLRWTTSVSALVVEKGED